MLQTNTVAPGTLGLLKKFRQVPLLSDLRLVGGTALALQLGHRVSVDLDLFGNINADSKKIATALKSAGLNVIEQEESQNIKIFEVNGVKVDMVNYSYQWLEAPIDMEGVRMAGLKDIAAMKIAAITNRGTRKDFVDIYFLLQRFSLQQILNLYLQKYPDATMFPVMQSVAYFADAEKKPMPQMFIPLEWREVKATIQKAVTNLVL
jgi:predicted nucleotidyltransferase component of viral defense system